MSGLLSNLANADFYPRPPRGGRRSITSGLGTKTLFLSTPSARRATYFFFVPCRLLWISIHALREEGDIFSQCSHNKRRISIHALREEGDTLIFFTRFAVWVFLSTPSARRATLFLLRSMPLIVDFYPRPPRGGRPKGASAPRAIFYFYPRPPRGGRRNHGRGAGYCHHFYPRPPRGGRPGFPL